jgi:hypothetical protein
MSFIFSPLRPSSCGWAVRTCYTERARWERVRFELQAAWRACLGRAAGRNSASSARSGPEAAGAGMQRAHLHLRASEHGREAVGRRATHPPLSRRGAPRSRRRGRNRPARGSLSQRSQHAATRAEDVTAFLAGRG